MRDVFGPFIPIFVPFVDTRVKLKQKYPPGFIEALNRSLRRDCLYVTVSQHDEGIFGQPLGPERFRTDLVRLSDIPNLLVLSSGGYGHVPLPLLKRPEQELPLKPMLSRRYFARLIRFSPLKSSLRSFVGAKRSAGELRSGMRQIVEKWAENKSKDTTPSETRSSHSLSSFL